MLGQEGAGLVMAMTGFDHGRIGIAAQAIGILQAALDESIRYAKEESSLGPHRPSTGHCLDDRRYGNRSFRRPFSCLPCRLAEGPEAAFWQGGSMAKLFATEAAMKHTTQAVQIHGGYGYIKGVKVERLMRDAKIAEIYEGTSEAQRMVISGNVSPLSTAHHHLLMQSAPGRVAGHDNIHQTGMNKSVPFTESALH